ncbi:hypothetical protein VB566_00290 [Clostridium perfringens]|uniref:hypothetical protein n=1 Tax=Clostridium perfringens TaxID=1502 RepID=UPI002B212774|nr:hypothetical protein [Clostridium perfringens]MEA5269372.1 hypothetical protein [Clostridium perfringens]MEA5309325.1 hypothetical protein [Clostridium perfringens]MEA5339852.1 hypothetical protein [Clostridium perfringens]
MTLEESVKRLEKALRDFAGIVLEAFRDFAGNILKGVLKLPPKLRYKTLKCLGVDKDKIVLFFNRKNQAKIKEQDRKYKEGKFKK